MRHGATDWNVERRAQGQVDIEMNRLGHRQAIVVAEEMAHLDVDGVYSSDLRRALDTARPIAEAHGLEVVVDQDLREINQGEWEGLRVEEIRRRWPDLWGPARHYSPRPGGESPQSVQKRALQGIRRIVEAHPDDTVIAVSHGVTIRWLSAAALGITDKRVARIRGLGNGGAVEMEAHLDDGEVVFSNFVRLDGNTPDLDDPNE